MIIGIILGGVIGYVFKSIILGIITFYVTTGINKSRLWFAIPISRRNVYLPPSIKELNIKSFITGIILWSVIIKNGDPIKEYFKEVEKGNERLP